MHDLNSFQKVIYIVALSVKYSSIRNTYLISVYALVISVLSMSNGFGYQFAHRSFVVISFLFRGVGYFNKWYGYNTRLLYDFSGDQHTHVDADHHYWPSFNVNIDKIQLNNLGLLNSFASGFFLEECNIS